MNWLCTDGMIGVEIDMVDSAQEAAQEYVDGGSWGSSRETQYIDVLCRLVDRWVVIEMQTDDCIDRHDSDSEPIDLYDTERWMVKETGDFDRFDSESILGRFDSESRARRFAADCDYAAPLLGHVVVVDDSQDETITIEIEPEGQITAQITAHEGDA